MSLSRISLPAHAHQHSRFLFLPYTHALYRRPVLPPSPVTLKQARKHAGDTKKQSNYFITQAPPLPAQGPASSNSTPCRAGKRPMQCTSCTAADCTLIASPLQGWGRCADPLLGPVLCPSGHAFCARYFPHARGLSACITLWGATEICERKKGKAVLGGRGFKKP